MLTTAEIKRFIDDDITSERKRFAAVGQRYYEARHDIKDSRFFYYDADGNFMEDTTRSNVKISHPFFTILTDQLAAFILSSKENPIRAKEKAEGLQEHLDSYFNAAFWAEISELIKGAYVKGFEYLYCYKTTENRMAFRCADSLGVVEVRESDTDDGCKYVIYWYIDRIEKGKKEIKRIQVWSDKETTYFVQVGNGRIEPDKSAPINPRPHVVYTDEKTGKRMGYPLGYIPFLRLDNNKKQFSGLKPIKGIIDDYDVHACSLSNNLIDFDTPLHVIRGFQGDNLDELQQNLKTKKLIGVDEEGGVDVQTIDIPYQARKEKLAMDKEAVFFFGMGYDPTQVGDGNITNIVIRSRYSMLELKAKNMIPRLEVVLDEAVKTVLAEINQENSTDFQLSDVEYCFTPEIMTNETENIQNEKVKAETKQIEVNTILNVAANIGDEETLKAICEVLDLDFDELKGQVEKMQEEKDTANAKAALESIVTEENPVEPEQPVEEE